MYKIHKSNIIIIWVSILALCGTTILGYGFSSKGFISIGSLLTCGIISTITFFNQKLDDEKKH